MVPAEAYAAGAARAALLLLEAAASRRTTQAQTAWSGRTRRHLRAGHATQPIK
jgi:hypothetical protein